MQIHFLSSEIVVRFRRLVAVLLMVSLAIHHSDSLRAELVLVGDTNPSNFPDNAGDIGGDLIIGDTSTGGLFMDLAPPLDGPLMSLDSDNGILGNEVDGIGAAVFDDFGVAWNVATQLTVGNEGQGFLDVFDSAQIVVGDGTGTTVVGDASTGRGDITVNGVGTLFSAGDLSVGEGGFGTINVNSRATLRSEISRVGSVNATGDGLVTLTDRGTRWSVRGGLTVGGLFAGLSYGRIEIQDEALLQIEETGSMTVNAQGTIDLAGGTIRVLPRLSNTINNNGIIRGDGFINGALSIGAGGLLSNAAANVQNGSTVTNLRENLRVSGAVQNNGLIESIGGEMIFDSLVTNSNSIIARDAILRFSNTPSEDGVTDLINSDLLSLAGDITVIGDIDSSGGDIFTLDNTTLLLQGNLIFTSGIFGIAANGSGPPVSVTGLADLAGATIDLVLSSGFSPEVGVPFALLQADDGVTLPSNLMDSAGGRIFDFSVIGNTLFAEDSGFLVSPMGSDFNGDGIVNALDVAIWGNNFPIASGAPQNLGDADGDGDVDGADFMKIQRDFGVIPVPPITAVPEPSTLAIVFVALACCPRRRKDRS